MVRALRWKYLPKDENLTNFSVPRQRNFTREGWFSGVGFCPTPPKISINDIAPRNHAWACFGTIWNEKTSRITTRNGGCRSQVLSSDNRGAGLDCGDMPLFMSLQTAKNGWSPAASTWTTTEARHGRTSWLQHLHCEAAHWDGTCRTKDAFWRCWSVAAFGCLADLLGLLGRAYCREDIKHTRLGLPWATSCFQKPRQHETGGSLLILRLFVRPKFQSYLE